mgnify:CR=1 FL=1|jgi:hypothetical protein
MRREPNAGSLGGGIVEGHGAERPPGEDTVASRTSSCRRKSLFQMELAMTEWTARSGGLAPGRAAESAGNIGRLER